MYKNEPLVSVIIPTYNAEKDVAKTIESVINQTYQNWEMFIVDDCSTDNTAKIAEAYTKNDSRITFFQINCNSGRPAVPRNQGIRKSRGAYVAFLDSDDVWEKQKLAKQLPHFQAPDIIGVASDAVLITETPYYQEMNRGRSKQGYVDYQYRDILEYNPVITSSVIIRQEAFEHAGLFDENKDFCFIEDWELWLRMARFGSFRVLEKPLLSYLVSRKRGPQSSIISKNCLKILEKQVALGYAENDDIKESKASVYLAVARNLLEFDRQQSRRYYQEALRITVDIRKKIKSYIGLLMSFLPFYLMKIILLILYKAEWILCRLKNSLWQITKIFYGHSAPCSKR